MKHLKYALVATLMALSIGDLRAEGAEPSYQAPTQNPHQVWRHHIDAWNERDLDEILLDYSREAVVLRNVDLHRGDREIARLFSQLFWFFDKASYHKVSSAFIPEPEKVIYITWEAVVDGVHYNGTDTFVVEHGKIVYQTITSFPPLPF